MLGNALIRNPHLKDMSFDRGVLFESLLFFDKIHVFMDVATLANILRINFMEEFLNLIDSGHLSASYSPIICGVHSDNTSGLSSHRFIIARYYGQKRSNRARDIAQRDFKRELGESQSTNLLFKRFCDGVTFLDKDDDLEAQALSKSDVLDPQFATEMARAVLLNAGVSPELSNTISVSTMSLAGLDFAILVHGDLSRALNAADSGKRDTITPPHLLSPVIGARLDVRLAAKYNASFIGSDSTSDIVKTILKRSLGSERSGLSSIESIYDYINVDVPRFRDVVNSGSRSIAECIDLLDRADRFKGWLRHQNPDADIIRQVVAEKSKVGFLESTPVKTVRFALFTGLGAAGDLVTGSPGLLGVAAGAFDQFVIDRLAGKWRPHHFLENDLSTFLDQEGRAE